MSTPDKTSETLDLAQAMNANPSTSGSDADNVVSKAKSKDDDLNANLSDVTKRLNDIDMSFRQKVVTQESSCDFMNHDEEQHLTEASTSKQDSPDPLEASEIAGIDFTKAMYDDEGLVITQPEDEKEWQSDVCNQMLKTENAEAESNSFIEEFMKTEERTVENIQVRPEVVSCPKCHRKVAHGSINHHIKYCNPE